ncbi:MAG: RNA methyltransferase [Treponema sp.]|nr:RNA methyltransferase [Treponema sp.]
MDEVDLAYFARLKDRDLRREGVIIAEGRLVAERVASRCEALGIICVPAALKDAKAMSQERIPIHVMSEAEISELAGFPFHRGLLLAAKRPKLPCLVDEGPLLHKARRLVVLPNITDPENMGAIIRTAAALGWDGLLIGSPSCDPYSRRVLRCSMAAGFSLPLVSFDGVHDLDMLTSHGWELWAAMLHENASSPDAMGSICRLALVLGNERFGVPQELEAILSGRVAIHQARCDADGVDSLNVAAAAAILLWEGRPPS